MGCVTAKSVLNTPREDLINKADLEEQTVDDVLAILRAEFEDDDNDAAAAADTPSDACAETSDPAADIAAAADGETRE